MQSLSNTELVGFVQLQVGSLAVQVPVRQAKEENEAEAQTPLATFETEGEAYAILIHGESSTKAMERAVSEAAKQAITHLSRKLLN